MCPYCGNHDEKQMTKATPILRDGTAQELEALGITVPLIRTCLRCQATLSPKAFDTSTPEYQTAYAVSH